MTFRDRLIATLRALQPVLELPGVLVVGSEVPNLLQPAAASTLVVSQDVDIAVPLEDVHPVKRLLERLAGMPDPVPVRHAVASLLERLETPNG